MSRQATFDELAAVLRDRRAELLDALGLEVANMHIPTDGRGLRILLSVPEDFDQELPARLGMQLEDGTEVEIPMEVRRDFQPFRPL